MLQKQLVSLDLTNGLSKKEPEHLRVPVKLDVCENLVFDAEGTLQPRPGVANVDLTAKLGSSAVLNQRDVHEHQGRLVIEDAASLNTVHATSPFTGIVEHSAFSRLDLTLRNVFAKPDGGAFWAVDTCVHSGLTFVVFSDSGNGGYLQVYDANGPVGDLQSIAATATRVRVAYYDATRVIVLYQDGSSRIWFRLITVTAPTTMAAAVKLLRNDSVDIATVLPWDVAFDGAGDMVLAWGELVGGNDEPVSSIFNPAVGGLSDGDNYDHAGSHATAVTVARFSSGQYVVAACIAGAVHFDRYDSGLDWQATATLAATNVSYWATCPFGTGVEIWARLTSGAAQRLNVTTGLVVFSATLSAGVTTLESRPFALDGNTVCALFQFPSNTQQHCWLIDHSGVVRARVLSGTSAFDTNHNRLTSVVADGTTFKTVAVRAPRQTIVGGVDVSVQNLTLVQFDTGTVLGRGLTAADLLQLPGALAATFDGFDVSESGFEHYPDSVAPVTAGAGAVDNGAHGYTALYEWVDPTGRVHRSAAAVPVSVTVSGGAKVVNVTVQNLQHTYRTNVKIVVYRTTATGTTYYRLPSPLTNNPAAATQVYVDNVADAAIISNPTVPFTGGVIEPDPLPACRVLHTHQKRVFAAGVAEYPNSVFYTHEVVPELALEFSQYLRLDIPPDTGVVTGLASLDDKLVVFTERAVWVYTGSGPDALGSNNSFSEPACVLRSVGMTQASSRSPCAVDAGVWFQSTRGLRLLTRGLSLAQAGLEADHISETCVGAVAYRAKNQVWFFLTNRALVFDEVWGQWSEMLGAGGGIVFGRGVAMKGAVLWAGVPAYCVSDGATEGVQYIDPAATTDPGATQIATRWRTSWFKTAAVQGFQRIWRVLGLGKLHKASPAGTFQLTLEKDYRTDADAEQSASNNVADFTGGLTSVGAPFQFKHHVKNQKVQALQIEVATTRAEVAWSNLALEIGVKRGAAKLASTRELT